MNELINAIKETESPNQVGDSARASGSTASQSFLDEVWGKKCLSKKGGCPDGPSELPDLPSFPGQIKPDPDYPIKPYEPSKPIKPYEPIKPEQPRQCVQDDDGAIACGVPVGPERPRSPRSGSIKEALPDYLDGQLRNLPGIILFDKQR
ncbi:MAG: hypothetical protein HY986_04825 [Candidatus Melainabacteria bacterium]|nr:hypothetical protein [Candidatus Melainabacteria bacterium]